MRTESGFERGAASFSDISEPPPVDSADIAEWLKVRGLKSYVVLRIRPHHYQKYFRSLPLPVLGGLNQTEKAIIASAVQEPVFLIFCWVHRLIVERRMAGGIREDAPIVSRIHQVLSDGMLGYENARKLCETPFPFPYAQGVALLLHLNSLGLPVLMANFVGDVWLTALSTFFAVMAFYLINEVAREIEEPFKFDPNELPVAHYQYKFNARLVTAFVKSVIPEGGLFSHIDGKELTGMICRRRPTLVPESGEDSGNNDKDFVELEQEPFQGQQTPLCRPSAPGSNHDRDPIFKPFPSNEWKVMPSQTQSTIIAEVSEDQGEIGSEKVATSKLLVAVNVIDRLPLPGSPLAESAVSSSHNSSNVSHRNPQSKNTV